MKKKTLLIILSLVLLSSCFNSENSIRNKIEGSWTIEQLKYNNHNYKDSLTYNVMVFKNDEKVFNVVRIPESDNLENQYAIWSILKENNNAYLDIESTNEIFRGHYTIKFIKDSEKKILGLKLKSETTNLLLYKMGQNYDTEKIGW